MDCRGEPADTTGHLSHTVPRSQKAGGCCTAMAGRSLLFQRWLKLLSPAECPMRHTDGIAYVTNKESEQRVITQSRTAGAGTEQSGFVVFQAPCMSLHSLRTVGHKTATFRAAVTGDSLSRRLKRGPAAPCPRQGQAQHLLLSTLQHLSMTCPRSSLPGQ